MGEIIKPIVPVFTFLINEGDKVYLQRRYDTGYLDGHYDTAAGKMEEGESPEKAACRELKEEAGVFAAPNDLELFHVYLNHSGPEPWLGLMFRTRIWQGRPRIMEPHKCDDAGFHNLDQLPQVTPQVRDGLGRILTANSISIDTYYSLNPS